LQSHHLPKVFVDPQYAAFRELSRAAPLYRVRFTARDLWPMEVGPNTQAHTGTHAHTHTHTGTCTTTPEGQ
jgi:hypothetical protein